MEGEEEEKETNGDLDMMNGNGMEPVEVELSSEQKEMNDKIAKFLNKTGGGEEVRRIGEEMTPEDDEEGEEGKEDGYESD